jgi:hypothetical protein
MLVVEIFADGAGAIVKARSPLLASIVVALLGCHEREQVVFDAAAAPKPSAVSPPAPPTWREAGRWTQKEGDVEWRAIVIAPNTPRSSLKRLARVLHTHYPTVFFDIYDDDAELGKLVAAKGDDDALPTEWREAHAVATIAGTVSVTDAGTTIASVQLYEWRTNTTTPL